MDVLPAIDLLGGECVRLIQGRYDRVITYQNEPTQCARKFHVAGARWLHVIDLDGARNGRVENLDALRQIVAETDAQVQFGGGVRDEAAIDAALEAGAARVIIGTRALEDLSWFEGLLGQERYAGRLALGLDARLGRLVVAGWTRDTELPATTVARRVSDWPLSCIVYTDVGHDGLLLGPNLNAVRMLCEVARVPVVASGGISELDDVRALKDVGVAGVVIGRALYEDTLDLAAALELARSG